MLVSSEYHFVLYVGKNDCITKLFFSLTNKKNQILTIRQVMIHIYGF